MAATNENTPSQFRFETPAVPAEYDPPEVVQGRCIDMLTGILDAAQMQLEAGEKSQYSLHILGLVAAGMAQDAVVSGDTGAVARYCEFMDKAGMAGQSVNAVTLFAAVRLGDPAAASNLHGHLNDEKQRVNQNRGQALLFSSPMLGAVIAECAAHDIVPYAWLDYAGSFQDRWQLLNTFLSTRLTAQPGVAHYQNELARLDNEFVTQPGRFDKNFVVMYSRTILRRTTDQEQRKRLIHNYIEAASDLPPTINTLNTHVGMSRDLLQDILLEPYRNQMFQLINAVATLMVANDESASQAERLRASAHLYYAIAAVEDITPDLTAAIITSTANNLQRQLPHDPQAAAITTDMSDAWFSDYAVQYARERNPAGARKLLKRISSPFTFRNALATCLNTASTVEAIEALRTDHARVRQPTIDRLFAVRHALISNNEAALYSTAQITALSDAQELHADVHSMHSLQEAAAALCPDAGVRIGRTLLAAVRRNGRPFLTVSELSLRQIALGDTQEPASAERHILYDPTTTAAQKLVALQDLCMQLTTFLTAKRPGGA